MTEWQDIKTAPGNCVILTDEGTATWIGRRWFLCTSSGRIPSCADWGREVSEIDPTVWMPLPAPPKQEKPNA
jgi:hypothetical protein